MGIMSVFIATACLTVFCVTSQNSDNLPRLIAHKEVLNSLIFQNKQLNVKYSIFNVGSGSAFDVELLDNTFAMSDFKIAAGLTKVKYERIGPGSNVSHSVVLIPQNPGRFNFTYAQVSYSSQQQIGKNPQIGYTSAPGEVVVYSLAEYERYFTAHAKDWLYFAGMSLPCILMPGFFWYRSYAKYCVKKSKSA
ncbi:translocon-associated protein subunit beta-like [Symsagittifera roscoffensis]|uniref:translocon-associated protein subunit beta-like n=1 Tax=Symsagittifera roscoffensis TaxID=84072 RepID=UPI00307B7CA4